MSSSKFDIIVYGATGFTGQLVVEYLAAQYRNDKRLRWAMAGRSLDKLARVRDATPAAHDTPLIAAEAGDPASLSAMIEQTKSIVTTVGPYLRYGNELVAGCAASGTDYFDLCGEVPWMRQVIDAHQAAAQHSGARIMFSCGYDSVPFELGVYFCQQTAKKLLGAPVARVKGRIRAMKGTFSGGTAASSRAIFEAAVKDPGLLALVRDPFALTPGFQGPKQPPGNKPIFDDDLQTWLTPFFMANINTRNVHRSNMLMDFAYGRNFVYDEMQIAGPGEEGEAAARRIMAASNSLASSAGRKPGEGPSKEERESGYYDLLFVGIAPDGRQVRVSVKGDRDPGYGSTSKMIAECAVCLLRDAADVPGGIWTPGSAMREALIRRLVDNAGLKFEVEM